MNINTNLKAYLDDFGLINVYISKIFYNGKSDYFYLSNKDGYYKECVINSIVENKDNVKYQLTIPTDYDFSKEYSLYCSLGICCSVEVRYIVRNPKFDEMFYYDGNDLGSRYSKEKTSFALWAPTAYKVYVSIENNGFSIIKEMDRYDKGVYKTEVEGDLKHGLYNYLVFVNGVVNEIVDPYGLSSNANGLKSAIIDIDEAFSEKDEYKLEELKNNVDSIIYEINIRDMTISKESGSSTNGKFSSLSESNTSYRGYKTGIDYISDLNVTHVQIMPVYDFVSVDEKHIDRSYNWGYDPMQYFTLEGSYSDNPDDPYDRIKTFKHLVCEFHKRGIRVNLDVVFNHIYDLKSSSFHKCVPYYYFRYDDNGGISNGSFCGNDLDSTKKMFRKLIVDNIKMWSTLYKIDGFRFDLMGIIDVDTINEVYDVASSINPSVMIYGEGWNLPTFLNDDKKAKIENNYLMKNVGHFNDYFRDSIKGKSSDNEAYDKGFITGNFNMMYEMLSSLVGNSVNTYYFKRFIDPNMSINYVEAHDNMTCWDKMKECCKEHPREIRKKLHKLLIGCVMVSQGVPFIHAGQEFCRSKHSMGNTYNMNDNFNKMDWVRMVNYYDVVEYTKKLIKIRKENDEFRLVSTDEIEKKVNFNVLDNVVIEYMIDNIKVIINPTEYKRKYESFDYTVIFDGENICNNKNKYIDVDSYSMVICRKEI
ncbi:MAG: type I pullulanase [Erysipelotrichaceae bacterium]|nr:type I pullulanase [Erysipelotrichaceae bacterium]